MESNIEVIFNSSKNLSIKEIKIENEYEIGIISPNLFDKFVFENYKFGFGID
jgi:hypothetical protein